jgi:DedD protein
LAESLESPGTSALRVGLTLGGIVLSAVVVFGLGVMEGSRVAELAPVVAPPPSALPTENLATQTAAPPAPAPPIPADKLTFYDRLSGVAPSTPVALPDGQAPAQGLASGPSAPPAAPGAQPESPQRAQAVTQRKPATPEATAAVEPAARTTAPPTADPAAQIKKLIGKGRFTVQLAAVGERSAAAETAAQMKRHGFTTVTVMASVKGKTYYRLRVGTYPSKQAAAKAAGIFRSAYGLNAIPTEN